MELPKSLRGQQVETPGYTVLEGESVRSNLTVREGAMNEDVYVIYEFLIVNLKYHLRSRP